MLELAIALSLGIGVLLGMLGGGGSVLLVPVLLSVLKLPTKTALATSQMVMAATTVVAMVLHARAGRVVFRTGVLFGLSGMAGSFLGGRLAHYIPANLLLSGFVVLMLASAIQMLRGNRKKTEPKAGAAWWLGMLVGFPTGLVAGMLGAGGGFLVVPALTIFGGLAMEQAVGTSLLVIAMQAFAGSLGYLGHSTVDFRLVGMLASVMAVGSLGGAVLSQRVPAAFLRRLFAALLIAVAIQMLVQTFF
ncbi:MAG TPA: sulfite exporter TauE/SafE family protein [Pseudomonadota bacterium]|nr:sulfite exporter TauE/SafE family protein [Pseudomonadota bacterium]